MTNRGTLYLFTDGSVNPQKRIGFGAYLLLNEDDLSSTTLSKDDVITKSFEDTSSSKLELEAMLWALKDISTENSKVVILRIIGFIIYISIINIVNYKLI